ncbi:MAG TPA: protein-methionine-sulfoxide reductase catalytic subunit MsrP [Burkholderiales bacterium]|nr:protein-methionine-sulfoxide reductase catalytic subunit MsrP [Burkholderiales bacterium]
MLIQRPSDIKPSEITPQDLYVRRREFIKAVALTVAGAAMPALFNTPREARGAAPATPFTNLHSSTYSTLEEKTPFKDVTHYNNFYEFGTDKYSPGERAGSLKTRPWAVAVEGEIKRPKVYDADELLKLAPLEERVYRLRCVEGWSMVIPWAGYPLSELIKRVEPTDKAKFVEFITLYDPGQMPGQRVPVLSWPYVEGLRLDEAMHPLTLLCFGLYGQALPNQNGAPLRIVVPWKYGFKGAKSIVRIRFVEKQPVSAWTKAASHEYGFYSNVNPNVDHPRWSQARERRIGEFFKRPTLMFNGYADQVASLYAGMDLLKNF